MVAQEELATLNGEPIGQDDLDLGADWRKLERQVYELRKKALDSAIASRLLALEAERRGVPADQVINDEIVPKIGEPTNKEVQEFYDQKRGQINKPLKEVRAEIIQVLKQQKGQGHLSDFLKELWASAEVDVHLDPPRLPVSLEAVRFRGGKDAPVTVIEYSDFQCPYCKQVQPTVAELVTEYEDEVRWGFKDMPLSDIHPEAVRAAQAARCADDQGKFWEFRAKLFEQDLFTDGTYMDLAKELKLRDEDLMECINSGAKERAVMADFEEARSFGIDGTPAFLVNGILLTGAQPVQVFRDTIDRELGHDVGP